MEAGADYGIAPCGILAMDMARVEAGLFMLDVDYTAAQATPGSPTQKSSPFEMGLDWTVNLDKPGYFVGRRALEREKREGSAWKMVGLEVDWEGLERLYAEVGLPPQIPGMAVRGSLPITGRPAGRLCLDQHLVAGAEEVHRARAPRAPALRARHARRASRSRSNTIAGTRRPRWSRCRSTSPSGRRSEGRPATTRSSSARATTA